MLFRAMSPASLYLFHGILANVRAADLLQSLPPCVKMMVRCTSHALVGSLLVRVPRRTERKVIC